MGSSRKCYWARRGKCCRVSSLLCFIAAKTTIHISLFGIWQGSSTAQQTWPDDPLIERTFPLVWSVVFMHPRGKGAEFFPQLIGSSGWSFLTREEIFADYLSIVAGCAIESKSYQRNDSVPPQDGV